MDSRQTMAIQAIVLPYFILKIADISAFIETLLITHTKIGTSLIEILLIIIIYQAIYNSKTSSGKKIKT